MAKKQAFPIIIEFDIDVFANYYEFQTFLFKALEATGKEGETISVDGSPFKIVEIEKKELPELPQPEQVGPKKAILQATPQMKQPNQGNYNWKTGVTRK